MTDTHPLCKFCTADGAAKILEFNSIFITSPLDLNDPFEMRPAWTNTHELEQHEERQIRNELTGGLYGSVEPPVPVENQIGIADHYNHQAFEDLHTRFRVLSLLPSIVTAGASHTESKPEDVLMWSHYGDHNQGVCLILDPAKFNNGLRVGGFPVDYSNDRKGMPVELYSTWRRLLAPRTEEAAQALHDLLYRNYIEILTRKSPLWNYEGEIRMIYETSARNPVDDFDQIFFACPVCVRVGRSKDQCRQNVYRDTVKMPADAILGVVVGADCPLSFLEPILQQLQSERYSHVKLYWATLHSSRYRMHYTEVPADHLQTYQRDHTERIGMAKKHFARVNGELTMPPFGAQKTINFIPASSAPSWTPPSASGE